MLILEAVITVMSTKYPKRMSVYLGLIERNCKLHYTVQVFLFSISLSFMRNFSCLRLGMERSPLLFFTVVSVAAGLFC